MKEDKKKSKKTALIAPLSFKKKLAVPPEAVFRAWTDPREIKKWFIAAKDWSISAVEVVLRKGGKYSVKMKSPKGEEEHLVGSYQEVKFPERLQYTWEWKEKRVPKVADETMGETRVTVVFHDRQGHTEIELEHGLFKNAKARDSHEKGWEGFFRSLDKYFKR